MAICERCGQEHEHYYLYEVTLPGGAVENWCRECVKNNAFFCEDCEKWYSLDYGYGQPSRYNSMFVCKDCIDSQYSKCDCCGHYERNSDMTIVQDGSMICNNCKTLDYEYCAICNEWVPNSQANWVDCEDQYVCDRCYEDLYATCDCCEESYRVEDMFFDGDCWYCDDCYNDKLNLIRRYHDNPETCFNGELDDNGNFIGFGIELEVDDGHNKTRCAKEISELVEQSTGKFFEDVLYFMNDGSLNNGFEIVTQPHTLKEFKELDWKGIFKILDKYDFKSHDTSTCGLHIHVSRTMFGIQDDVEKENIGKILYFYENNYDEMKKFSRRRLSTCCSYAKSFKEERPYKTYNQKECRNISKNNGMLFDRYQSVNLKNQDTVEFRLGRGTLNFDTFLAWIEFHLMLVANSHKIPWNRIEDMSLWFNGISPEVRRSMNMRSAFISKEAE